MAGSYKHVTDEQGRLLGPVEMQSMIENGGDVYEAVEQMYGMVWWMAAVLNDHDHRRKPADWVRNAEQQYMVGLSESPGMKPEG